jgi:hypothetical protein
MPTKKQPSKSASCSSLTLPELDQSKMAVLNMPASAHSRRSYKHAIEKFIAEATAAPELPTVANKVALLGKRSSGSQADAATL